MFSILISSIEFEFSAIKAEEDYKVVCYYGAWSVYRPPPFNFGVDDIDPYSCTHLIYSFAGLDETSLTIKSLDTEEDIVKGNCVGEIRPLPEENYNFNQFYLTCTHQICI